MIAVFLGLIGFYGTNTPDFLQSGQNNVELTLKGLIFLIVVGLLLIAFTALVGFLTLRKKKG